MAGKQCIICQQPDEVVRAIDKDIYAGKPFRRIHAEHLDADKVKNHVSVFRHAEHLKVDFRAVVAEGRIKRIIDVYDEFTANLDFARELREKAREALSDPADPLRMTLIPQANEIDIVYDDWNDMQPVNGSGVEKPARKRATLAALMQQLADKGFEADKISIKNMDIRKLALDAIAATDSCIDKFARIEGVYQKSKTNEKDPAQLAADLVKFLVEKGRTQERAIEIAKAKYGTAPLQLNP